MGSCQRGGLTPYETFFEENINDISYCITQIYDSESGGTVPMKRVMNAEGQPLV